LITGRADNEADLRRAFNGVTNAFVNTNGFAIGEKSEIYWGMRIYEIAKETTTMRHYVWSNLDYGLKLGGYNEKYKCGHYDGKGTSTWSEMGNDRSSCRVACVSGVWRWGREFRMECIYEWTIYGDVM
jgi:hypothetical protein